MNNTEKKIDALIDALGFDISRKLDFDERKESPSNQLLFSSSHIDYPHTRGRRLSGSYGQRLDIDDDGNYTSMLIKPVINYKLTKREEGHKYFDCCLTEQIVMNIVQLSKSEKQYRWIMCQKESFDAAIKWFGSAAKKQSKDHYYIYDVSVELKDEKI